MKPTVSVVITCYNYGEYLAGCLESVLSQTYTDYEIIIIDDGSTDNTSDVVKPYCNQYSLIQYIKQENAGQANAKNQGIKKARGQFIAFLDADDLWHPKKLEKQMVLFADDNVGVVYSRQRFVDEDGKPIQQKKGRVQQTLLPKSGKITTALFIDNFVPFSSSVVRSECFKEFEGFDESIAMGIDWDLWLRISTRYHFDYVDEPLLLYRIGHSGQMSKNILTRQECSDRIMDKFKVDYPEELPASVERQAMAFTFCNRGYFFRHQNLILSTQYFLQAWLKRPFWIKPYYSLLKNCLFACWPNITRQKRQ
ncbi:MAG: glycosyltransferase [Candidatus Electrothrix sp. AUS4]|nr:glycosyltransferase [Candidatus Electrothrix sp. AUS4]